MIKMRKKGCSESWNNPYKNIMETANVFFLARAHVLFLIRGVQKKAYPRISGSMLRSACGSHLLTLSVLVLCGCRSETSFHNEIPEEFTPNVKKQKGIDLPNFGSCPDGWKEVEFDAGHDHKIPYCEPPSLAEFNPDSPQQPSLPNFLPCPPDWTEVEDATTGLVTCHPYGPDGPEDCDDSPH